MKKDEKCNNTQLYLPTLTNFNIIQQWILKSFLKTTDGYIDTDFFLIFYITKQKCFPKIRFINWCPQHRWEVVYTTPR